METNLIAEGRKEGYDKRETKTALFFISRQNSAFFVQYPFYNKVRKKNFIIYIFCSCFCYVYYVRIKNLEGSLANYGRPEKEKSCVQKKVFPLSCFLFFSFVVSWVASVMSCWSCSIGVFWWRRRKEKTSTCLRKKRKEKVFRLVIRPHAAVIIFTSNTNIWTLRRM